MVKQNGARSNATSRSYQLEIWCSELCKEGCSHVQLFPVRRRLSLQHGWPNICSRWSIHGVLRLDQRALKPRLWIWRGCNTSVVFIPFSQTVLLTWTSSAFPPLLATVDGRYRDAVIFFADLALQSSLCFAIDSLPHLLLTLDHLLTYSFGPRDRGIPKPLVFVFYILITSSI